MSSIQQKPDRRPVEGLNQKEDMMSNLVINMFPSAPRERSSNILLFVH